MTADSTYAQSAISIVTDWVYGILPIFIVWHLKMSKQKRVGVALVLGLGAVASSATIVRVPYLVTLTRTEDFLFATVDVAIWSTVEPGIGITAVSFACLRPLLRTCLSRIGLSSRGDDEGSNSFGNSGGGAYAQRKHSSYSPYGLGSQDTAPSDNDRSYRAGVRKSTSFLDDESPERDPAGGVSLSPVSPRAAAGTGIHKGVTFSSVTGKEIPSPTSLTRVDERPEFDRSRTEGTFYTESSSTREGNYILPRPPSAHRNFSRPQSAQRNRDGSFNVPRPLTGQSGESVGEDVLHMQRRGSSARNARYYGSDGF